MKKIAILIAVLILFNCLSAFSTDEAEKVSVIITVNGDFDAGAFSETFGCKIIYTYEVCLNGFAAEINRADIYKIKSFKGVEGVFSEPYYNIPEPVEEEETEGGRRFRMMSAEETSFPGEGTAVAVIDSGCNVSNTAFGLPADTAGVKYSESDIADILSRNSLNAETSLPSLTANGAYKNAKFPFAFDYAGKGTDVYNASVPHGNSVAGIIGAKGSGVDGGADYTGVLPECQLIIMKVVSSSGAIKGSDVLAALEDSVVLGVDGINISLGATAGFSTHEADEYDLSGAIASARAQGIFVSVAAGNDGLLGRNGLKTSSPSMYPSVLNPDYGLVCNPSTAFEAVSVGSASTAGTSVAGSSAWGPTPDLKLKPDICAPGVSVRVARNASGSFQNGSGTSYAAPYLCGKGVAAAHYIKSKGNYGGLALSRLTDSLLMSSADIITSSSGVPLSPRKQGSGFANIERALSIKAVMYGSDGKTKLSIGDFTGNSISLDFKVKNITDEPVSYSPSLTVTADGASGGYITCLPEYLPTDSVTFSPAVISLSAGEEKEVTAQVVLNQAAVLRKKNVFSNGFYVDGFITLSGNGNINMPFTGFCGNWAELPVFIPSDTAYGTALAVQFQGSTAAELFYLGNNFFKDGRVAARAAAPDKVAFSPNSDGIFENANPYLGLYRNLKNCRVFILDSNGNTVKALSCPEIEKTQGIETMKASMLSWNGKNGSGALCPDGRYYYVLHGDIDYPGGTDAEIMTLPVFLDTTPPEITGITVSSAGGGKTLTLNVTDNHYISAVAISNGETAATLDALFDDENNGVYTFDISDYDCESFLLEAFDYALNSAEMTVSPGMDYVAYYRQNGVLDRVSVYEIADTANPPQRNITLTAEDYFAKRFIWNHNMEPVNVFHIAN